MSENLETAARASKRGPLAIARIGTHT